MDANSKLPYLYWLPKLQKVPISHRFIAASALCSTTGVSSVFSDVLNFVLRTLRDKDDRRVRDTGVRRYFVVQSYEEVAFFFAKWRRSEKRPGLYTGDFSTMYTAIPHDDLFVRVRQALQEAWQYIASERRREVGSVLIEWKATGVCWVTPRRAVSSHSGDAHRWTLDGLMEAIVFLVRNVYLVNGERCWRQCIGMPMGTNCAPPLANLYLYAYESDFVDRLEMTRPESATIFRKPFRLIDDPLSAENPSTALRATDGIKPSVCGHGSCWLNCVHLLHDWLRRGDMTSFLLERHNLF
eukprot:TRINITY_DN1086_c1_g1_i13.p1 TRINITY_DN1086_c1_g1~~TRINITY_DN1086_c1_g1_i13.p1  ORF type:complete len:297 (-),score=15.79 TRINITY_DN1086_c1_g1_i13:233-1123(-)